MLEHIAHPDSLNKASVLSTDAVMEGMRNPTKLNGLSSDASSAILFRDYSNPVTTLEDVVADMGGVTPRPLRHLAHVSPY